MTEGTQTGTGSVSVVHWFATLGRDAAGFPEEVGNLILSEV